MGKRQSRANITLRVRVDLSKGKGATRDAIESRLAEMLRDQVFLVDGSTYYVAVSYAQREQS